MPTLYQVLGVHPSASVEEVRRAYKQKALETHPDKLEPGASVEEKERAEQSFHQVHNAFSILGDTSKRKAYDIQIQLPPSLTFLSWSSTTSSLSDKAKRRMQDRAEWQRQQQILHQTQMAEMRERTKRKREEAKRKAEEETTRAQEQARIVQELVDELFKLTPEWERRRAEVMQRRASRMAGTLGGGANPPSNPLWNTVP
ncbi:hypothetical protein GYMLUDRAFT_1018301 [Collybiopsis luxurians FD-317 M1]|uniref:J domain-containing protein n=1 Tax=Collybiopsis luxurians FD-317 M1 TaxID=944289 RepID=A0A0D0CJY9_9AGAR|nr:hypothetical protein GYMLUDRAFT_1018301 [Collybiopsis luxurians FD-317 M1]